MNDLEKIAAKLAEIEVQRAKLDADEADLKIAQRVLADLRGPSHESNVYINGEIPTLSYLVLQVLEKEGGWMRFTDVKAKIDKIRGRPALLGKISSIISSFESLKLVAINGASCLITAQGIDHLVKLQQQ